MSCAGVEAVQAVFGAYPHDGVIVFHNSCDMVEADRARIFGVALVRFNGAVLRVEFFKSIGGADPELSMLVLMNGCDFQHIGWIRLRSHVQIMFKVTG